MTSPNRSPLAASPSVQSVSPSAWMQGLVLFLLILIATGVGVWQITTPEPAPASASEEEFSAERAMEHLEVIGSESRAIGMPGHDTAREYLIEQLEAMGLQTETQTTTSVLRFEGADAFGVGNVSNVIARLPGTESTGAIVLNAHYDSGETGPGASDCGACVVTVLETVRAIQAAAPLRNDVIIVFTDAEEHGDLGAAAFTQQHPMADDVALALNYETQGSSGPSILYATSSDNSWLVSEFLDVAPDPRAYSLLPEIVSALPAQRLACDLQDYLERGNAGLGFVYLGDTTDYHTLLDNTERIDLGSVQQQGDYTVALVEHFGNLDLTSLPRSGDRVFFNLVPQLVIHYPASWVLPLAGLVTVLAIALLAYGVRQRTLTIGGTAASALVFVAGTAVSVLLVALLWMAIRMLNSDYQVHLIGTYQSNLYTVALSLVALSLMAALTMLLRNRFRLANLAAGAIVIWTVLLWLISVVAPGASYLVIWPLLFGLLPLAWILFTGLRGDQSWWRVVVLGIAAAPGFILLPATAYGMVALLNRLEYSFVLGGSFPVLGLWAIFVAPLGGLLVVQFDALSGRATTRARWISPAALGLAALALIVWGNATSGFDAEQPRPDHIAYEVNVDSGDTRWISLDPHLDDWTSQFFPANPERVDYEIVEGLEGEAFAAFAPGVQLEAPEVAVISDTTEGDLRTLHVQILSPRGAPELEVRIETEGTIEEAIIDDRPLELDDYERARDGELSFSYVGVQQRGIDLEFQIRSSSGPVSFWLRDTSYGLPELPDMTIEPRPAGFMPATGLPLDATIMTRTVEV